MGRLEKVGAAVVGVLLCIIIVVGLLNKNEGRKGAPDASRESAAIKPADNRDPVDPEAKGKPGPTLDLKDLLNEEQRKAEERRQAEIAARGRIAVKPGPEAELDPTAPTPGPEVAPAPVAGAWPKEYEVKSGDILGRICLKEYGTASMVAAVKAANPGLDPRNMRLGTKISLPAPAAPATVKAGGADAPAAPAEAGKPRSRWSFITPRHLKASAGETLVSAPGGKFYTVKKGDTLSSIAQRELGSSRHVSAIVEANRKLIPNSKSTLQVGWKLVLPNLN